MRAEPPSDVFFNIATGSPAGTYFPIGQRIATIISHPRGAVRCAEDGARCGPPGLIAVAQASDGSVSNVRQAWAGRVQSVFAQADIAFAAQAGAAPFSELPPRDELRAIARLYPEALHLVADPQAGIRSVSDLKGRRVSIDREGSGTHSNALLVLKAAGLGPSDVDLSFTDADQNAERILFGDIDAYFLMAGAPVRSITELTLLGLAAMVPISGPGTDSLIARTPYLWPHTLPPETYPGAGPVQTVGVGALWLVHKDVNADLVYRITQALWHPANRTLLAAAHPQAVRMTPERARMGVPVPFHPGAERFYREAGLDAEKPNASDRPRPRSKPPAPQVSGL